LGKTKQDKGFPFEGRRKSQKEEDIGGGLLKGQCDRRGGISANTPKDWSRKKRVKCGVLEKKGKTNQCDRKELDSHPPPQLCGQRGAITARTRITWAGGGGGVRKERRGNKGFREDSNHSPFRCTFGRKGGKIPERSLGPVKLRDQRRAGQSFSSHLVLKKLHEGQKMVKGHRASAILTE